MPQQITHQKMIKTFILRNENFFDYLYSFHIDDISLIPLLFSNFLRYPFSTLNVIMALWNIWFINKYGYVFPHGRNLYPVVGSKLSLGLPATSRLCILVSYRVPVIMTNALLWGKLLKVIYIEVLVSII